MATTLSPYLNFTSGTRDVMEFYRSVFGGRLDVNTFASLGEVPPGVDPDGVMHAQLATPDGWTILAADMPPGQQAPSGSNISVAIFGDDAEAMRGYFAGLAEGGTVSVPLAKQMWGDEFGICVDRFGVSWMVNIDGAAAS